MESKDSCIHRVTRSCTFNEGPEAELVNAAFVLALLDGEDTEPLATGGGRGKPIVAT